MIVSLLTKRDLLIIRGTKKKIIKFNHMKTTKTRLMELAAINNPFPVREYSSSGDPSLMISDAAREILSTLADPVIKKNMDGLADTLDDAQFMAIKKLYDGLYTELKKYE